MDFKWIKKTVFVGTALFLFIIAGCNFVLINNNGNTGTGSGSSSSGPSLTINAGTLLSIYTNIANAMIMDGITPVTDATVIVQGVPLSNSGNGMYSSTNTIAFNSNDIISFSVTRGSFSLSNACIVPGIPNITAPTAAGGPYDSSNPISINWDPLTPAPASNEVNISSTFTTPTYPNGYTDYLAGSSVNYSLPADVLNPASFAIMLNVYSMNITALAGAGVQSGSYFMIENMGISELINTQ